MSQRTHVDLFSGIGGFAIAAGMAGYRTICFAEVDEFCVRVLAKHWPGVPNLGDIRKITANDIRTLTAADVADAERRRDRREYGDDCRTAGTRKAARPEVRPEYDGQVRHCCIDLLTGGIPCQPASVAGKRKGSADERWLWPDAIRVIREVRPRRFILENVPGIIGLRPHGLDWILEQLEGAGYQCVPLVVGADDVGAPHRRKRVWIVGRLADAETRGVRRGAAQRGNGQPAQPGQGAMADSEGRRCEQHSDAERQSREGRQASGAGGEGLENADGSGEPQPGLLGADLLAESGEGLALAHALGRGGRQDDEGAQSPGRDGAAAGGDGRGVGLADADRGNGNWRTGGVQVGRGWQSRDTAADGTADDESAAQCGLGRAFVGPAPWMDFAGWPARPGQPQYPYEPPRTCKGQKDRAKRLKALGNAIVWPVAYAIITAMQECDGLTA